MKYINFSSFVLLISIAVVCSKCPFHPSLWCSSSEISALCEVEEQCSNYNEPLQAGADKVEFALYYESLCPDCEEFIQSQLWPTYKAVGNIMNITMVPYGNAREKQDSVSGKWLFDCQHGEHECIGNLLETCVIYTAKEVDTYMPMIYCMETSPQLRSDPRSAAMKCASQVAGIDFAAVDKCANSSLGNKLEHDMAVLTEKLQPPHTYVPWVTLHGVHTDDIQTQAMDNLKKLVCDNYKGQLPKECQDGSMQKMQFACKN